MAPPHAQMIPWPPSDTGANCVAGLKRYESRRTSSRKRRSARRSHMKRWLLLWAGCVLALGAVPAWADGQVNIVCSVPMTWCQAVGRGVHQGNRHYRRHPEQSSGEAMAQILAERANPKLDVYYTGTGDPHLQAAEMGLTEEYKSPQLPQLHEWAIKQAEAAKFKTVGVYSGALGARLQSRAPREEEAAGAEVLGGPRESHLQGRGADGESNSSGTAYATLATFVAGVRRGQGVRAAQGDAQEHQQLPACWRRPGPVGRAGRDRDCSHVPARRCDRIQAGFPVKLVVPCEGTGYEVGSMSIVEEAKNMENAKKFYEFALTPAAQKIGGELKNFQTPSNKATPPPPGAPDLGNIKLINYDFAKYGSAAERKRILEKWDKEVYSIPRS